MNYYQEFGQAPVMPKYRKNRKTTLYIFGALFAIMIAVTFFLNNSKRVGYSFEDDILSVTYADQESISIPVKEITSLQVVEDFEAGSEAGGLVSGSFRFGAFHNDSLGDYQAALSTRISSVIIIETKDNNYAINFENKKSTQSLCEAIGKLVETETAVP